MKSNVSFLRRLGSIMYDLLLVFSFVFFIAGVVILINKKEPITNSLFFYFLTLPVIFGYFSFSWVKGKQTLGMRAWKFEISQFDGDNITYRQSLTRMILALISLTGLGFLFQFFNQYKLPIHDYYSKTYLSSLYK
ncbi:RDD family protein [Candidatus Thioglobus sp. NP1]|uniref:RDD family protein n=1 Tax=Candidatus Thioglobus sp. NP1 TaxID=2508687 RepID=UPI000DED868C|nr:RDD family protein [Candidatus Thioglobus sp. NP1]AXE62497.1 RDD family protein [Candidatus Thioglobus sp. NP1]|tara:strand:+ start:1196 stop:1600 length:405 start_codon:yes stop_codon:yes gene_type:complete